MITLAPTFSSTPSIGEKIYLPNLRIIKIISNDGNSKDLEFWKSRGDRQNEQTRDFFRGVKDNDDFETFRPQNVAISLERLTSVNQQVEHVTTNKPISNDDDKQSANDNRDKYDGYYNLGTVKIIQPITESLSLKENLKLTTNLPDVERKEKEQQTTNKQVH